MAQMGVAASRRINQMGLQRFSIAVSVFLVGLVLSALAAYVQYQSIDKSALAEFERMALRTEAQIVDRMENVVHGLRGVRGLYATHARVRRLEFQQFVLSRDMAREFPGVRGFGFIQRVDRSEIDAFVASERADGAPQFASWPKRINRICLSSSSSNPRPPTKARRGSTWGLSP